MDHNVNAKTGSSQIVKVGQTYSGAHGSEPNAVVRGPAAGQPTPQDFGTPGTTVNI